MKKTRPFTAHETRMLVEYCRAVQGEFSGTDVLGTGTTLPFRIARSLFSESTRIHREEAIPSAASDSLLAETNLSGIRSAALAAEPESELLRLLSATGGRRHIFVTGDGGIGKTGVMRQLTCAAATTFLAASKSRSISDAMVPVHCHLKWLVNPSDGNLLAALCPGQLKPLLNRLQANGRLLLLLDGLDELNSTFASDEFDGLLTRLFDDLGDHCALALAGRESALRVPLRRLFQQDHYYRLEPLNQSQIERFIRDFFGRDPKGGELLNLLRQSHRSVRQLYQRPFFLVLICDLFKNGKKPKLELPKGPSDLLDISINHILGRRQKNGANPAGMNLLLAIARAHLGQLAAFSCEQSFEFQVTAADFPKDINDGVLEELDAKSGILTSSGGGEKLKTYTFSNRMLAEFLAGEHLAQCRDEEFLSDFYSRNVWSDQNRNLLRSLASSLWRHQPAVAARIGQWILRHIDVKRQPRDCRWNRDDLYRTLGTRFVDLVGAAPYWASENHPAMEFSEECKGLIEHAVRESEHPIILEAIAALPTRLSRLYFRSLGEHLHEFAEKGNWAKCLEFFHRAVTAGWTDDVSIRLTLLNILSSSCVNPAEQRDTICGVANTLAAGWPGDSKVRDHLLEALSLCHDQSDHLLVIAGLSDALAAGWPGDEIVRDRFLEILSRRSDVGKPACAASGVAHALATGWRGDSAVRDSFTQALAHCTEPENDGATICLLAVAMASGWRGDAKVKKVLLTVLSRCTVHQRHWLAIAGVASALASGWSDEQVNRREQLLEALSHCTDPKEHYLAIIMLANCLAVGWPGNGSVRDGLLSVLSRCDDPHRHRVSICSISFALALGWGGDAEVRDRLLSMLAPRAGQSSGNSVHSALLLGWPGDPTVAEELVSRNQAHDLQGANAWRRFVVMVAAPDQLEAWATMRGCNLSAEGSALRHIAPSLSQDRIRGNGKVSAPPQALLVVPREELKLGLDPRLQEKCPKPTPITVSSKSGVSESFSSTNLELVIITSERRVFLNGNDLGPVANDAMTFLCRLVEEPRCYRLSEDLLPPRDGLDMNKSADSRIHQSRVNDVRKKLPKAVRALIEHSPGGSGSGKTGRILPPHIKARVVKTRASV